jgi:hypothetical protein
MACSASENAVVPGIVPNSAKEKKIVRVMPSNVIGEVENIYLPPMKSAFQARIDTGATTSSIDVTDLKQFERDGDRWVSFTIENRETKEKQSFEKPLSKRIRIRRSGENERRPIVEMDVKMGGEKFKADFTLAERSKFDYQALVGRNILSGRAIVDVSVSNTLK